MEGFYTYSFRLGKILHKIKIDSFLLLGNSYKIPFLFKKDIHGCKVPFKYNMYFLQMFYLYINHEVVKVRGTLCLQGTYYSYYIAIYICLGL
jgi:hypothetical protein